MGPEVFCEQPLRVLIDVRKLGHGGIGEYAANLVGGLLGFSDLAERPCVQVGVIADPAALAPYAWAERVEVIEDHTRPYSLREYFSLARSIPQDRYDIFHEPHYTLPFGIAIPSVVTIHDLIHLRHPRHWYYPYVAGVLVRSAVQRAASVIAVSRASKDDLCRLMGERRSAHARMWVLPNAISGSVAAHVPQRLRVMKKFELCDPFYLAVVSQDRPHKGVADLERAFAMLKTWPEARHVSLVVAGQGTTPGERDGVRRLGPIAEDDLLDLYAACRALVVPSLAEGFCIPALHAKAFGTPVVGRPLAPLAELLEPPDILCADMSVGALCAGMREALSRGRASPERVQLLKQRYNHLELARQLIAIYLDVSTRIRPWIGALITNAVPDAGRRAVGCR